MIKMEIKEKLQVKIEELAKPPYCEILCYPRLEEREAAGRTNELKSLRVKSRILRERKKGCIED